MDLAALADFNLVATHGGFGRASRASGRSKATLSRRVAELESNLGVLHAHSQVLLTEITEVGEAVRGRLAGPSGRLRISAPLLFSHVAIGRIAVGFTKAYPEVRLEIIAEDRYVDLVEEGYDIAIRVNPRPGEQLVGRCFVHDQLLLVAPASLARPPRGTGAGQTVSIPAVVRTNAAEEGAWRISSEGWEMTFLPDPVLCLSTMIVVRDAVSAGAALLPYFLVAEELTSGRLVTWGAAIDPSVAVWVLHTSRRLVSSKVTAFVQFVVGLFPDTYWDGIGRTPSASA
jgi:DNA-binding transcriptional LysR family regulator